MWASYPCDPDEAPSGPLEGLSDRNITLDPEVPEELLIQACQADPYVLGCGTC